MSAAPGSQAQDGGDCARNSCLAACVLLTICALAWVAMPAHMDVGHGLETIFMKRQTTMTTTLLESGGIELNIRVNDMDFPKIGESKKTHDKFTFAVKYATAFYVGRDVQMERVGVVVDHIEELVHAYIVPPCDVNTTKLAKVMNFTSLGKAIAANLQTTEGWQHEAAAGVKVNVVGGNQFGAECDDFREDIAAQIATLVTTAPPTTTTTLPRRTHLVIKGASGPSARVIDGTYIKQDETLNDRMVLRKKDEKDIWLVFELSRWYITDTKRYHDNAGGGWLYSEDLDTELPTDASIWQSWDGTAWAEQKQISMHWTDDVEQNKATKTPEMD